MKKSDLGSILKKAATPEISEASLELFPRRVVSCLKNAGLPVQTRHHFLPRFAWAMGLLTLCISAICIFHHQNRPIKSLPADSLTNLKVIRETLALFPNRVRAVVEDEHGLNLILSDNDDVPTSPPLYVRICDGKRCASFVTFSGQQILAAGQKITVLSNGSGGIILIGKQFVWSKSDQFYAGNRLKIAARNLDPGAL